MRCLRKTDLPPPLRPMITVIEPVGISRSRPRKTGCEPKRLVRFSTFIISSPRTAGPQPRDVLRLALPYRPDEVVPDEDEHGGEHDGLRGRARHTLGAVAD